MNDTVSFEKKGNVIRKTEKKNRKFVPGMIERSEEHRINMLEMDMYIQNLVERRFTNFTDANW